LATWSRVDLGQEEEYLALILNLRYSNFFSIRVKLSKSIIFYYFISIFGRNFGGQATLTLRGLCRQEVERLHGAEMKIFDYLVEKLRKLFMIRDLPCCQTKGDIWSISLNKTKLKIHQTTTLYE
jgi:hypothetical protein